MPNMPATYMTLTVAKAMPTKLINPATAMERFDAYVLVSIMNPNSV